MKIKQTIRVLVLSALFVIPVLAAVPAENVGAAKCGGADTAIIECSQDNKTDTNGDGVVNEKDSGVWGLLLIVINVLTAGVGVVALAGLVYGAILYSAAGGNPEQVKKARAVFTNIVIGIVAFAGMWALLNFIIPGGVL